MGTHSQTTAVSGGDGLSMDCASIGPVSSRTEVSDEVRRAESSAGGSLLHGAKNSDTDAATEKLQLLSGGLPKAPRSVKDHLEVAQQRQAEIQEVQHLPAAAPKVLSREPEKFGSVRGGGTPGVLEIAILRHGTSRTASEKDHMRRTAGTHSLARYEFSDPTSEYLLRRPIASCKSGALNPRNAKDAKNAHFREFCKDGVIYIMEFGSKNCFGPLAFPENAAQQTDRTGKGYNKK